MIAVTTFISRRIFEEVHGSSDAIFISISGGTYPCSRASPKGEWKDGIFLQFDDVVSCTSGNEYVLFNEESAAEIIAFVEKYSASFKKYNLIVHCHAGISRSAAVAKFVNDYFSVRKLDKFNTYKFYNKLVYRTLVQTYTQQPYGDDDHDTDNS